MRRLARRRRPISDINVVPYLDVLLVLLVIFMITAPLFNQGIVDLPKVGKEPLPEAQKANFEIVYRKTAINPYLLTDVQENEETDNLSEDELIEELDKQSVLYDEIAIIISADEELGYGEVMKLLGRLRDEGYGDLALSAETES